jgi:vitamin B12 transporter
MLAVSLLLACATAFAYDGATDLGQVVVTATRTSQVQDRSLAPVSVIDRADIERLQARSLADLLRGTPGMALTNTGGPGKNTSMFLRGTESDHVLVLVDGLKLGSATAGTASIQDIPVEQIERVEIVRGPFSSLYGSEAIGGVVQIFTRRPAGPFTPNASIGAGGDGHYAGAAGFAGKQGSGWYALQASREQTDGINACRVGAAEAAAGCFADQPDRDGYRNDALSLRGGYRFGDAWEADALALRSEGHSDFDGSATDASDTVAQVAGGRVHYRPARNIQIEAAVGQTEDLSGDSFQGRFSDRFDTRRTLGSLQADVGGAGGLYTVGFDWQRDRVDSIEDYSRSSRFNRGLFGQWQQSFGSQSLQASVRRDDNSQFGGTRTGSVLWGWDATRALRLTASYGSAYKAPTFNELYYPSYGNPGLQPERSRNLELGLRGSHGWGFWSLHAFQNRIDGLIAYDASARAPANIDRARIRGAEGEAGGELAGWTIYASATWLDPRNDGDTSSHGHLLPRRPRQMARVDLDRAVGDFSLGGSWYVAGRRYDDLANRHPLGGYSLADLRASWAFAADWKLQLSLENVFDRRYETAWFYNQPGRDWMLTLRYQPAVR